MAFDGLPTAKIEVPLAAGLNQKADPRALQPPALDIALNVQFDEAGGLQLRKPFVANDNSLFAGAGSLANCRRLVANDNELLVFTKDTLYSQSADGFVSRSTYLAAKIDEASRFVTVGDQTQCDRAELSGIVVYAFVDTSTVYVAAADKATGAVVLTPTAVIGADSRPRLVALTTKILLFTRNGANLEARALDPTNPGTGVASAATTVLGGAAFNSYYDVVKQPGADTAVFACRRAVTTSYTVGTVTAGLVVTTSTKARTCDGPIAVSCEPTGAQVQVVRANATNIQGDLITISTLADVNTAKAVGTVAGTPVDQIAAAHRSVQNGGAYRCYAFWTAVQDFTPSDWTSKYNYVDTAGSVGAEANFVRELGVGSRAFGYDGSVYVNMAFASSSSADLFGPRAQLQNTHFLYRDDALLVAKIAPGVAGGYTAATGWLPGVALTSGSTVFSWCATERRRIDLGGGDHVAYAARAPRDVTISFDSNDARRVARLGATLYVAGGEILQYDGVRLTELGFHVFPWAILTSAGAVTGGTLADGTYTFKATWRSQNAKGETDRSTTATYANLTLSGGPRKAALSSVGLFVTHKTTDPVAIEWWRTPVNPTTDSPFYLVTSVDPAATTNPNRYVANSPTSYPGASQVDDALPDASLTVLEENPENGAVLENLAAPAASLIVANDVRLFLAGIAGDPDRVWYSKQRENGLVASFNDFLTFTVPRVGGDITALAFLFDTLIVFRETAIYEVRGDGYDNTGNGSNYEARLVSADVGAVNHESVGLTPMGLIFKTSKGWYLLPPNLAPQYIGAAVSDYDGETPLSVHVLETRHQVRVLTSARMLVWDYLVNQWAEWTISDGLHATIWNGTYVYLNTDGPKSEQTTYSGVDYGLDVETAWIKPAELQGQSRVRRILGLGEYRSAHGLRIRLARDYESDGAGGWSYYDDVTWVPPSSKRIVGGPEQFAIGPSKQRCEAVKIRLTSIGDAIQATRSTAGNGITNQIAMQSPAGTWTALLEAIPVGTLGNVLTITAGLKLGTTAYVEVRDRQTWDPVTETWSASYNNIGIQIVGTDDGGASPVTAAAIEAAFSNSELVRVATPHASPSAQVDMSAMTGLTMSGTLGTTTAGVNASTAATPTGEALKLTGLALLVGVEPGLYRRLAKSQKAS